LWRQVLLAASLFAILLAAHSSAAMIASQPAAMCLDTLFAIALQLAAFRYVGGLSNMSTSLRRWKSFWDDKTVPLHKQDDDTHYALLANELKVLFPEARPRRILEIGCGNGALYRHLDFDRADIYKGVDFSASMLDGFRSRYPGVALVAASGHNYRDDSLYDLIFSNGVVQYFDRPMLAEHFQRAAAMLSPGGALICASVPWRTLRSKYLRGGFASTRVSRVRSLLAYGRYWFSDPMGHWYEWRDLESLGRAHGFTASFYGSLHYPYRFHAVFRRSVSDQSMPAAA
jgi:SAM-dependent methyltransferase